MKRATLAALLGTVLVASAGAHSRSLDVRLGNNTEAITLMDDRHDHHVAVLDGYDVLAVPIMSHGHPPAHKLFDLKRVAWAGFPSGLVFLPNEEVFLFADQGAPDTLVAVNDHGRQLASRTVTRAVPLPFEPVGVEGLVYMPHGSPFPDSVARAIFLEDGTPRIEILSRNGAVQQDIALGSPLDFAYLTGLAILPSGEFLVSTADPNIWRVATDGSVVDGPFPVAEAADVEGLVALDDGRVYAADYTAGRLFAFDGTLQRRASRDRAFPIGLGMSRGVDGVWDPSTGRFITIALDRDHQAPAFYSLAPNLASKQTLFTLSEFSFGLTRAPNDTFATCRFGQAFIDLYNRQGAVVSSIGLGTLPVPAPRRCLTLAYLPSLDAYAVRLRNVAFPRTVFLVSSSGALLGQFDTTRSIVSLATPLSGPADRLLVWEFPGVLETFTTAGTLLSTVTPDVGDIVQPQGFITTPRGYAILDPNNSEFAVFDR